MEMLGQQEDQEEEEEQEKLFNCATGYVRASAGTMKQEDLLYLYARYKQVNDGPCNTSRPGMFDFQGKQKWDAWKKIGDMTRHDAMCQYIERLCLVQPDWELKLESGEVRSRTGMGVGVSTLGRAGEEVMNDAEKTVFDWCKEGNVNRVIEIIGQQQGCIDELDESGLALLHWACDRGLDEMVVALLDLQADINVRDTEGQTPLHYAASCEHRSIVSLLISRGADPSLQDESGALPQDSTDNTDIINLLASHVNAGKATVSS